MLYIRLGEFTDNCIIDVSAHFDLVKKPEWFQDNFIKYVIKGIDNTDVIEGEFLKSPVFGGMMDDSIDGDKLEYLFKDTIFSSILKVSLRKNKIEKQFNLVEDMSVF